VRLDRVGKRYGIRQPWVVREVSLEIPPGRLVRFEGKNGTGKSTLLRVIAGVSAPSNGSVTGRPVTGYVPERFPPALPFTARDYLAHVGRIHGLTGAELSARVEACLDQLGGSEFGDIPLRHASKGTCQKVAVAQALLARPGLLVLDEAWTGLDEEARSALDAAVAERLAEGGSVVFVDHDKRRLADLTAERWRIEKAQLTPVETASWAPARLAGAAAAAAGAEVKGTGEAESIVDGVAGYDAGQDGESVVVIELSGCSQDPAAVGELPGVLSAVRDGDRVLVRAEPGSSDAVLRALLAAGEDVHVDYVGWGRPYRDGPGEQR